jgi:hypothetical protein
MPSAADSAQEEVEISVGPHPRRLGWRVVRVSYPGTEELAHRVARALTALTAPVARNVGAHQPSHCISREAVEPSKPIELKEGHHSEPL